MKALLMRWIAVILLLNCAAECVSAGSPAQSRQDEQIKALLADCLKRDEELQFLTRKVAALEKLTKQDKELIEALEQTATAQEKQIAAYKKALEAANKIEVVDSRIQQSFEQSLNDAKNEIAKWKGRASFWKKFSLIGSPVLLLVGAGVGYVLGSK